MIINMVISFFVGIMMTFMIWVCHDLLVEKVPLLILNLMGVFRIPGGVITFIITAIILPQKSWQAIHEVSPFNYFTYAGNFIFYFFLTYFVQFLIVKIHEMK